MVPGRRHLSCFAARYAAHVQARGHTSSALAYESVVSDAPSASAPPLVGIVLHGLLGSGRNWRSFARRLADSVSAASRRAVHLHLLDMRNHGASARWAASEQIQRGCRACCRAPAGRP